MWISNKMHGLYNLRFWSTPNMKEKYIFVEFDFTVYKDVVWHIDSNGMKLEVAEGDLYSWLEQERAELEK